jgi:plasmid stabilization system protein ParE
MAARLIWSQEALDDVDAIAEYISRDSPRHAHKVAQELFALAEGVAEQPRLGRKVPELNDENLRERFLYSYRLIYEISDNKLYILAVIHGKRLLEAIEERLT